MADEPEALDAAMIAQIQSNIGAMVMAGINEVIAYEAANPENPADEPPSYHCVLVTPSGNWIVSIMRRDESDEPLVEIPTVN